VGPRHRSSRCRPSRSPRTLPSHPFSSVALSGGKTAGSFSRSRGLRALLHRRVRGVGGRFQPLSLGAPLGLSDSSIPLADPLGPPPVPVGLPREPCGQGKLLVRPR
jgi:hypothetical protein